MIKFGSRSIGRMVGLHPDIVRVLHRAAADASPALDFMVLEGVRSREQMMINYGKGRSGALLKAKGIPAKYAQPKANKVTWLGNPFNSKHALQSDGYSHAVDCVPFPIDWNDLSRFDAMAKLILAAADKEKVNLVWGCDWDDDGVFREKGETDSPHFQLA